LLCVTLFTFISLTTIILITFAMTIKIHNINNR
jgi:hypothetical protein